MDRTLISEFPASGNVKTYLMLKEAVDKTAKTGKTYVALTLSDGTDSIVANMWDRSLANFGANVGDILSVALRVSVYNDKPSYTLDNFYVVPESEAVKKSDFIKSAPMSGKDLYQFCIDLINNYVDDDDLKKLTLTIYQDNKEQLIHSAAAKSAHHNGVGELLWHSYRMALMATYVNKTYRLNRALLVAGALLHDIGKLKEMNTDAIGVTTYTIDGNLFGHLFLGAEILDEYGVKCGTPADKLRALKHIIVSHHGELEFGAIAKPMFPEAYAIHVLDLLDSRIYMYDEELNKLEENAVSDRVFFLDNTPVWKMPKF